MEVILLEKIRNLGDLGDKVSVANGYGRNYLVPHGKAVYASEANIAAFEARRAELESQAADVLSKAESRATKLKELSVTITAKAGDEGKLFGSIGTRDVADAVTAAGIEVTKAEVRMPTGVIRNIGEYEIELHLHTDVDATVKVVVAAEE